MFSPEAQQSHDDFGLKAFESVSYTHLDVYKRQPPGGGGGSSPLTNAFFVPNAISLYKLDNEDVYKRQILPILKA